MSQDDVKTAWQRGAALVATTLLLGACGGNSASIAFEPLETAKETKNNAPPPPSYLPPEDNRPPVAQFKAPELPPAAPAEPPVLAAATPPSMLPASADQAGQSPRQELAAFVESWRNAWAEKNIDAYLSFYAPNFKGYAATPEAWRASRKLVLGARGALEIRLSAMNVSPLGDDRAEISFDQYYRSPRLADNGRKLLLLVRRDGRWQIEQESFTATKP